jgi:hypothetical protein
MVHIRRYFACALFLVAMLGSFAGAKGQKAFDGTWRADMSTAKFSPKPFVVYISGGWFHCESCTPKIVVPADGQDHAVADQALDTFSITIVDLHTIHIIGKKSGKVAIDQSCTASSDGKTLTCNETDYPMNGGKPVTSDGTSKRVGTLPAGVHATSGQWVTTKVASSDNGLLTTYKVSDDQISMTDPTGDAFTATLNGGDAPVTGSTGWDEVSLKKVNDHTIEETDKFKGKVTDVSTMTVSANGKSMNVVTTQKPSGRVSSLVMVKQ